MILEVNLITQDSFIYQQKFCCENKRDALLTFHPKVFV